MRIPGSSELNLAWVLRPLTPAAYTYAADKLGDHWRDGIVSLSNQLEIFTYKNNGADLSDVLADLEVAGVKGIYVAERSRSDSGEDKVG